MVKKRRGRSELQGVRLSMGIYGNGADGHIPGLIRDEIVSRW